jgi:hypothetical protein
LRSTRFQFAIRHFRNDQAADCSKREGGAMLAFVAKAKQYVWDFIELAFAAVLGIMLIYLVLGKDSGVFVLSVAANVIKFTNDVPAGNLVAFAIVGALLYWFVQKSKSLER